MIELRPYQRQAKAAINNCIENGQSRNLVVMATGTGKTTLFADYILERHAARRGKSLVLAHREELIEQAARRIESQTGLCVGVERADSKAHSFCDVVVASVQTVGRNGSKRLAGTMFSDIISDECHHAPSEIYQNTYKRFGVYDGACRHLGVTATPDRLDNRPLTSGKGNATFEGVAYKYDLRDAIEDRWLVDLVGYRTPIDIGLDKVKKTAGDYNVGELSEKMDTPAMNAYAYEKWQEVCPNRQTIAFCVSVKHSLDVAEAFKVRGIKAACVHGGMSIAERTDVIAAFRSGEIQFLANCQIATEGFDVPSVDCILLLRPTQSAALYTQMIGRGTRTLSGVVDGLPIVDGIDGLELRDKRIKNSAKPDCVILDVADLSSQHSAISLSAALGLPPNIDLNGKAARKAWVEFDKLDSAIKEHLYNQESSFTFEDMKGIVQKFDLFAIKPRAPEVIEAGQWGWVKTGNEYHLSCGKDNDGSNRSAKLTINTIGQCVLQLKSSRNISDIPLGDDVISALYHSQEIIKGQFPRAEIIADITSKWQSDQPSDKQMNFLKKLGMQPGDLATIKTKRQASNAIDLLQRGKIAQ